MQQGDYSSYYQPYSQFQNPSPAPAPAPAPNPLPAPIPSDPHQNSYASAPPFTAGYGPADYSAYSQNYPPYPQNRDPAPPTAPSFSPVAQLPPPTANTASNAPPPFNQPPSVQPPSSSYPPYDAHGSYQQSAAQVPPYHPPYDHQQTAYSYGSPPSSISQGQNLIPNAPYSSVYSAPPYSLAGSSVSSSAFDNPYENSMKFDHGGPFIDDKYGGFSRSRPDLGLDPYGKRSDGGFSRYDDGYGDGVYAYEGSKVEPYGARGTAPRSSGSTLFDDYGRSISFSSGRNSLVRSDSTKIARAVPKADTQEDLKSGVQKFRVKLLAESFGQSTDVLCQVSLDGIRMLDPNTGRTLRIYPLENITRCDKIDSCTVAFWSKSTVDPEPRRIRLQSNSYTTNTLLDTVTAATVQLKEIGGSRPSVSTKTAEPLTEKKRGFADWMTIIKPVNEEKDHWVPDEAVSKCAACGTDFNAFVRKHHCRNCGDIFCDKCTHGRIALTAEENAPAVRVCDRCMAEVTQRLNNAREAANRQTASQSHEDLARKLQEEMERNRKASSGSRSDGSGRRMKEVACPTCTVHLQVQVPTSGSETIECGVCQSPFLVSAH